MPQHAHLIEPALDSEIQRSLTRIEAALEALPEHPNAARGHLQSLNRELRGLRGAYTVLDCSAAADCAEEMLRLVEASGDTATEAACSALDDAALLLATACDGEIDDRDLQRVLNGLRSARNAPVPTAAELLAARAMREGWPAGIGRDGILDDEPAEPIARRELTAFQSAFLAWFRQPAADDALSRIAAIAERVAAAVVDDRLRALWRAHATLAGSLIGRKVDALDIRRLLGRAGSQLKTLAEQGEAAAVAQAGDTVWLLLHALATADSAAAQSLRTHLLAPASRPRAIAADRGSRAAVVAALLGEFAIIKDAIDLRLRSSGAAVDIGPDLVRLRRLASVVGLLGLAGTSQQLQAAAEQFAGGSPNQWLPTAMTLLAAELGLEAAVLDNAPLDDAARPHHAIGRDAGTAVIREMLIDCARLKSGLEKALRDDDADARASLSPLLQGLSAALRVFGADAVADAAAALRLQAPGAALASAVVCLEVWLEARRDGAAASDALAAELARQVAQFDGAASDTPPASAPSTAPSDAAAAQAELRALFLDEAAEVLAATAALAPAFERDPTRRDTLVAFRRAFHTLKGSGRTVGADAVGALGGALETLLDRALDGAIGSSRALITVLDDGLRALPRLLDRYRDGEVAADPVTLELIERAERVAAGQMAETVDVRTVFCTDARSRLDGVRQWLASRDRRAPGHLLDEGLARSFHTLRGSAGVVNAVALSRLAGMIESTVTELVQARVELPARGLDVLDGLVQQMAVWVEAVADDQPVPEDAADRHAEPLASLAPAAIAAASTAREPDSAAAPVAEASAINPPVTAGEAVDVRAEPVTAAQAPSPAPAPAIDPELEEIFLGEAQELLDALAVSSGLWGGNAEDSHHLGSLRRGLHTLKGSARMAGAAAIGAVAHRLETMLEATADHPATARVAAFDAGLDGLQRQLDGQKRGQPLPAAPVLSAIDAALGMPVPAPPPPSPQAEVMPPPGARSDLATDAVDAADAVEAPIVDLPSTRSGSLLDWLPGLFPTDDDRHASAPTPRRESARVPVERLDTMLDQAGEIAIARAQLDEHHAGLKLQLNETTQTIARIREQLRQMDIETDAQISARSSSRTHPQTAAEDRYATEFDALEMDRYSRMQELSRALAESVGDLGSLHASMEEALSSAEALLVQQGRQTTDLQQGLMSTLMVPFSRQEQRLTRVVRQTAAENGRDAEPVYIGADAELDRNLLERMVAPLEHLLRNAVVHGIETPDARRAVGKPARGTIEIKLAHEGSQLVVEVADDGRGLDHDAIRRKAIERGLISGRVELAPDVLARFIFEPGFSTANRLTQDAGRGIGMDVVANQVRQLGGTLELRSEAGQGTRFIIRLPLALAVSQALLVGAGSETFAIPLAGIEGVARLARHQADALLAADGLLRHGDEDWPIRHLADHLDLARAPAADSRTVNALLLRLDGGERMAMVVDRLIGSREIVSKGAGSQLASVPGIGGATILADGRVAMILDLPALLADSKRRALLPQAGRAPAPQAGEARLTVMVVDDSITVRRVTERLLLRQGYRVLTAKDGVDAMAQLHVETPDAVLLDIEMPRADGFEVAAFIRQQSALRLLPIVMVTSRSGEKHRARARQLGVDGYLTKPWQDEQLLATLRTLPGIRQ